MHLKRYFAPKTWKIQRKELTFISRPSPGPHNIAMALPLGVILRDMLNLGTNSREIRFIVQNKDISVDGIRRKDKNFPVGLFDVLSVNDTDQNFRVVLDKKGRLELIGIEKDEKSLKPCRIVGKKVVKGKIQLNLYDGKNISAEKDGFKVGDTILIDFGKKNGIREHIKLEKNSMIYLTGGKSIGQTGKVQDIKGNRIIYKNDNGTFETLKEYAFAIGKDKPLIKLEK